VAQLPSLSLMWRYGCRRGRMTRVMSSQGVVPVLLLTVHGHIRPINRSEHRDLGGPRGSPSCQRVARVPRSRRKSVVGVGRF
jgi:hypothetical protein